MILDGKAAIVTGAGRGVAKGIAMAFAKSGANVLIVDRDEQLGQATEDELRAISPRSYFVRADLAQHDRLDEIVASAVEHFGKLDILVNAAQAAELVPLADTSNAVMRLPFDTGFWPTFLLMRAAYPHLQASRGCVINFGTGASFNASPAHAAYVAAKEAIRAISKVAANEWGADGIRVNIICPFANSPGVQQWAQEAPQDYEANLLRVPLRRMGDCEADIGAAAVFLASDSASYITGHTLMVDGGLNKAA